jgi:acyl-CoA synthetase (AMP-forming)/AMP-acid ligase II
MAVSSDPDRPVVTEGSGRSLSATELETLARAAAGRFGAAGSEHVGYCGVNGVAFPVALFGAALAGLPFVPLNYRLSDEQLAELLGRQPLTVVAAGDFARRLAGLGVTDLVDPADLLSPGDRPAAPGMVDPDQVALTLYTSGTTSAPKAALLRHRHLTAYVINTVEFGAMDRDQAVLVSVPPYHVAGVMNLVSNLYSGRRIVYLDPFEAEEWLRVAREERVTHAMVVPTMLARIVKVLGDRPVDAPALRSVAYGGAPMPAPVIEHALAAFPGVDFTNAYGLTETSSTITVLGPEDHRAALASDDPDVRRRLRSAGRPVPGIELEVRAEDGSACAAGEVGEIVVRGEQVAGEYAGGAASPDGWFCTRDRGWLDAEGYLFIEGRADDTIIRGGENIAPAEVEDVLLRHEAVADCAVVGLPDEEWGQRVGAAVVLVPGASVTSEELRAYARGHLRSSKAPEVLALEDELPYSATGKLLRRTVRERLSAPAPAAP